MSETKSERTPLERHFQTGLQIVLMAIVLWMGRTLQESTVKIAELGVKVAALQQVVAVSSRDQYTGSMATRDFGRLEKELAEQDRRLRALEMKAAR